MPGSNPLFGLNTLGGALAVQTKDGVTNPGTSVQLTAAATARHGRRSRAAAAADGFDWYAAGNRFTSTAGARTPPSDVGQLFGKLGWRRRDARVAHRDGWPTTISPATACRNSGCSQRDYASVYTVPDQTRNRSGS